MGFPKFTIPFRFFQGGHMPESSGRVVNYPTLSRDYPQPKPNKFNQPWHHKPTYSQIMAVVNHLTDLNSRKRRAGAAQGQVPIMAAPPQYQAPPIQYAAPPAEDYPEMMEAELGDGSQPQPSARRYRRW